VTAPRFLIDENLSVKLPEVAHAKGFSATHVNHLGLGGAKDWDILKIVEKDEWVLVTNNAFEFRGRYNKIKNHPGVVFLVPSVTLTEQMDLFAGALDDVLADPDLINKALDVDFTSEKQVRIRRYALP
jgi:predicted nuclease of predicted toxin-antitoxin system